MLRYVLFLALLNICDSALADTFAWHPIGGAVTVTVSRTKYVCPCDGSTSYGPGWTIAPGLQTQTQTSTTSITSATGILLPTLSTLTSTSATTSVPSSSGILLPTLGTTTSASTQIDTVTTTSATTPSLVDTTSLSSPPPTTGLTDAPITTSATDSVPPSTTVTTTTSVSLSCPVGTNFVLRAAAYNLYAQTAPSNIYDSQTIDFINGSTVDMASQFTFIRDELARCRFVPTGTTLRPVLLTDVFGPDNVATIYELDPVIGAGLPQSFGRPDVVCEMTQTSTLACRVDGIADWNTIFLSFAGGPGRLNIASGKRPDRINTDFVLQVAQPVVVPVTIT